MNDVQSQENNKTTKSTIGIIFILEDLGFDGKSVLYQAYRESFKPYDINFDQALFSRACLTPSIEQGINNILSIVDSVKEAPEKLTITTQKFFSDSLDSDHLSINQEIKRLIFSSDHSAIKWGGLSALPLETANNLLSYMDNQNKLELQTVKNASVHFPSKSIWHKMTAKMGILPRSCIALTTTANACKSALSAGLRCVAAPDQFTAFQDFSGVDLLVEDFKQVTLENITELLTPCSFRQELHDYSN
jgi:beta-phosphoglucomutase-like phosphatase (HAD superfamily)